MDKYIGSWSIEERAMLMDEQSKLSDRERAEGLVQILSACVIRSTPGDYTGYGGINEGGSNYLWNGPEEKSPIFCNDERKRAYKSLKKIVRHSNDENFRNEFKSAMKEATRGSSSLYEDEKALLKFFAIISSPILIPLSLFSASYLGHKIYDIAKIILE
ncbi:MAG: hypothetical protein Q7S56_00375 [Nanoarchaeota archaeon]|nr:hypothetical protein [Nanoarchaeota archaeon]